MRDVIAKDMALSIEMDVHSNTIRVCVMDMEEIIWEGNIVDSLRAADEFLNRLPGCKVHVLYEAGPFGFKLARHLERRGVWCSVVCPSMIPVAPGERVKTNRRDVRRLAILVRDPHRKVARVLAELEESRRRRDRLCV